MVPLVLLPAFPLDAQMYRGVVGHMAADVVTPDLPGFGGTAKPQTHPSIDVYADAVAAELDSLGLGSIALGGTSMGGYVAMAFCRRYAERVAGLALIDTKATADSPAAAAGRRAMAEEMEQGQTTQPLIDSVLPKLLGETTVRDRPEVTELVRGWVLDAPAASAAWAQRAMADRPDSFDTLRQVGVPSLVVVGAEDVLAPPPDAEAMALALNDVEVKVLAGAGHLTPVEAPLSVAQLLDAFLQRIG